MCVSICGPQTETVMSGPPDSSVCVCVSVRLHPHKGQCLLPSFFAIIFHAIGLLSIQGSILHQSNFVTLRIFYKGTHTVYDLWRL